MKLCQYGFDFLTMSLKSWVQRNRFHSIVHGIHRHNLHTDKHISYHCNHLHNHSLPNRINNGSLCMEYYCILSSSPHTVEETLQNHTGSSGQLLGFVWPSDYRHSWRSAPQVLHCGEDLSAPGGPKMIYEHGICPHTLAPTWNISRTNNYGKYTKCYHTCAGMFL